MRKFELIDEFRNAWRFLSVQLMVLSTAILGFWSIIPEEFKHYMPDWSMKLLLGVLLIGGIGGRLIKQKRKPPLPEIEIIPSLAKKKPKSKKTVKRKPRNTRR